MRLLFWPIMEPLQDTRFFLNETSAFAMDRDYKMLVFRSMLPI